MFGALSSSNGSEESSSYVKYFSALNVVFLYVPIALLVIIYSIIVIKLKTQKIPGEQSVNAGQQRAKRNQNVLKVALLSCWGLYCAGYLGVLTPFLLFFHDVSHNNVAPVTILSYLNGKYCFIYDVRERCDN